MSKRNPPARLGPSSRAWTVTRSLPPADGANQKFVNDGNSSGRSGCAMSIAMPRADRPYCANAPIARKYDAPRNATQSSRSEEHTSELQSLMRTSYAVFCLTKKQHQTKHKVRTDGANT